MWWCAGVQKMDQFEQSVTISYPSQTGKFLQMTCTRVAPNNAFKPKPLRSAKHMAGKACHVLRSTTRLGLTWVLGAPRGIAHEADDSSVSYPRYKCSRI